MAYLTVTGNRLITCKNKFFCHIGKQFTTSQRTRHAIPFLNLNSNLVLSSLWVWWNVIRAPLLCLIREYSSWLCRTQTMVSGYSSNANPRSLTRIFDLLFTVSSCICKENGSNERRHCLQLGRSQNCIWSYCASGSGTAISKTSSSSGRGGLQE